MRSDLRPKQMLIDSQSGINIKLKQRCQQMERTAGLVGRSKACAAAYHLLFMRLVRHAR